MFVDDKTLRENKENSWLYFITSGNTNAAVSFILENRHAEKVLPEFVTSCYDLYSVF